MDLFSACEVERKRYRARKRNSMQVKYPLGHGQVSLRSALPSALSATGVPCDKHPVLEFILSFCFFLSYPLSFSPDIFSVEHGELPDSSFILWKTSCETQRGGIVYEPTWKCTHCVLLCVTPESSTNTLWGRSLLPGVCERRPGLPQVGGCLGFALLLTQL